MNRTLNTLTNLFPLWVTVCGVLALFHPSWFTWFKGPLIVWGLAIIMLGMGITLSLEDFKKVARTPRPVALGVIAQFCFMPFMGWSIAYALNLPPEFSAGLILVSCCPGGTASNVVVYIARANIALSVLMTMCSTFAAIALTPVLTQWLAGKYVPVDAWALFRSTVQIVLLPIVFGMLLNRYAQKTVERVKPAAPLVAVITIVLIVASILGARAEQIRESGGILLLAVTLMHMGAFTLGYGITRVFGFEELIRRTVAIEVGMQNSGLGSALAVKHFTPSAATPCAVSAIMHCILGSFLAALWRRDAETLKKCPEDQSVR
jgi:BASS family bile acid:Na+ symporter